MSATVPLTRSGPPRRAALRRAGVAIVAAALVVAGAVLTVDSSQAELSLKGVPRAVCAPGDLPETTIQGRVPTSDYDSGRAALGYRCNTEQIGHHGQTSIAASGGFKVQRYTDVTGRTCAYYDSTALFGVNIGNVLNPTGLGVVVLDMTDPSNPVKTANLITPAMLSPHESLLVNDKRGLLVAVLGNAVTAPGIMDVYDVSQDCRHPVLKSTTPSALFGHESGFASDGLTFWSGGAAGFVMVAVDLTNPSLPQIIHVHSNVVYHGLRLSADNKTMYVANMGSPSQNSVLEGQGLDILDVSDVQDRKPNPQLRLLSKLTWDNGSIPQVAEPFTRNGRQYVFEVDEFTDFFGHNFNIDFTYGDVGAARIIDVTDPRRPRVVSNVRLEVHDPLVRNDELFADPGANGVVKTYSGHYCSLPTRNNPKIAGCSMIASGLRLFDISDVERPREVGYFNQVGPDGGWALSQPAWDVKRRQIWYTDADEGFFVVGLKNRAAALLGTGNCVPDPTRRQADSDRDGLTDAVELKGSRIVQKVYRNRGVSRSFQRIGVVKTDPCLKDTDRDGLTDAQEVRGIRLNQRVIRQAKHGGNYVIGLRQSDPKRKDTDGDGLTDRQEVTGSANARHGKRKSDPARADTDSAGLKDGAEVKRRTDPTRTG